MPVTEFSNTIMFWATIYTDITHHVFTTEEFLGHQRYDEAHHQLICGNPRKIQMSLENEFHHK